MTVRWKPLIVLSGLFLVVAVFGLLAVTLDLIPANAAEVLPQARKEWRAGRYGNAQIHFLRALQHDPKNAKVHLEVAQLYEEWAEHEDDPAKRAKIRAERTNALQEAAKYGRNAGPRQLLLTDALANEDSVQCVLWGKKLLDVDQNATDAHYALMVAALDAAPPDSVTAARHLEALAQSEANRPRTVWAQARLARVNGDEPLFRRLLEGARSLAPADETDPTDRLALVRLRQLDVLATSSPAELAERLTALEREARALVEAPAERPGRLVRIGRLIDEARRHQVRVMGAGTKAPAGEPGNGLESVAESAYQKAMAASGGADLTVYQEYAEHLLDRGERRRCLDVVDKGLKLPTAAVAAWAETVTRLHEIAIQAALRDEANPNRFTIAEPHIKELLRSQVPIQQAVGHLFQGIIELDRSGLLDREPGKPRTTDAKLRGSALAHLKVAAVALPDSATAQALYGVALILTGEQAIGRQYLLGALRLPNLDARYQVWSAWAMIQAGYPEDAQPIVERLQAEIASGQAARELAPTLGLLVAEVLQARRTPESLRQARSAFEKAQAPGAPANAALQLRIAAIDLELAETDKALARVQAVRKQGEGGVNADHLLVQVLAARQEWDEARKVLDQARASHPDSGELVALDAFLNLKQDRPEAADAVLAEFLKRHPRNFDVVQMRAQLLVDELNRPAEARKLLAEAAEIADSTGPIVKLALLEINQGDLEAAAATITKLRARWKEAAAADLLDAQLAMRKGDARAALAALDSALNKDPSNKLALFWKAQLDARAGSAAEATRIYESLVDQKAVKEIDTGLSLSTAASWALASIALENQDPDAAIARLQGLLDGGLATDLERPVRWQLATAFAAKGQWPSAQAEIEGLLKSPGTTNEERVRAANLYRLQNVNDRAVALLDTVLKAEPSYSPAIALRAFLVAETKPAEAAALLRKAIDSGKQPPSIYLMLAALENTAHGPDGPKKAMAIVDEAIGKHPESIELVQARYRLLRITGDTAGALAYVRQQAEKGPNGALRRYLVDVLRDEGRYQEATAELEAMLAESPPDQESLAELLVRMHALQAVEAGTKGDRKAEERANAEALKLIHAFRAKYPRSVAFPQAECEYAARTGQLDKALAITREIDKIDPNSPIGPMLRGQIAAVKGWSEGAAEEFSEAVTRAPRRIDLRLALAQASLAAGRRDDAIQQAGWVLEADPEQLAALLLKARALADQSGPPAEIARRRAEAIELLRAAGAERPKFVAASHLIAEIQLRDQKPDEAIQTLTRCLETNPGDAAGLALLVQTLAEPRPDGQARTDAELADADRYAERFAGNDRAGTMAQAVSVGFHKAGAIDRGLAWAERAAALLDDWTVHLNHADLLMAKAEAAPTAPTSRPLFEKAVTEYQRVLKSQANSIEAVNNVAWVLTQYLDRPKEALAIAEGLVSRVDPTILPPDFYDTLGATHEALGRARDAEDAYLAGLKRAPDHPALNFHMGRLIAADASRAATATPYLEKAQVGRGYLPPTMTTELDSLLARAGE